MSKIYYDYALAENPQDALCKFTEKERLFQEKYGFRTDHLLKVESVKMDDDELTYQNDPEEHLYFWKVGYTFRRASL